MNQVAKLVMIDGRGKYLLMYRSDHPAFGNDPDIPGGTLEEGEQPLETMIREVFEEAGVVVNPADIEEVYAGTEYSASKTCYSLFTSTFQNTPEITMSWEHSLYEWLDREDFLEKAKGANDTYMHMVYDVLKEGDKWLQKG
jgi:8-oxo-dGTP pyrophosphatase MutT (NUDIX family)